MDNISELDKLTLRTRRREFEDGLFDFVVAGAFMLLAVLNWLVFSFTGIRWVVTALLWNRELTIIGLLALFVLLMLSIYGMRKVIDHIRSRTLWKDQGSVKPMRWQVRTSTTLFAVMVFIVLLSATYHLMNLGVIEPDAVLRTLVSATGIATGMIYIGLGLKIRLLRYRWVGIAGLLLSAALIFMPLSFAECWLAFGLIWMLVLGTSGVWASQKSFAVAKGIQRD